MGLVLFVVFAAACVDECLPVCLGPSVLTCATALSMVMCVLAAYVSLWCSLGSSLCRPFLVLDSVWQASNLVPAVSNSS